MKQDKFDYRRLEKQCGLKYFQIFVHNAWANKIIPSHLDSQELIANSWNNCADVEDIEGCFRSTVEMFIDQNCSTF